MRNVKNKFRLTLKPSEILLLVAAVSPENPTLRVAKLPWTTNNPSSTLIDWGEDSILYRANVKRFRDSFIA